MENLSTQIQHINKTPFNDHIERNNRTLYLGQNKTIQNADQSHGRHGPIGITCKYKTQTCV